MVGEIDAVPSVVCFPAVGWMIDCDIVDDVDGLVDGVIVVDGIKSVKLKMGYTTRQF